MPRTEKDHRGIVNQTGDAKIGDMKFVLASHNQKKLLELGDILGTLGIEIVPLPAGAPEPDEDGGTFEANALIKARAAAEYTGLPAVADDSGLCVDALHGAPGVYSARYGSAEYFSYMEQHGLKAGLEPLPPKATDRDRCLRLLRDLEAAPDGQRTARFVCAIACVLPDGQEFTVRGACEGEITRRMHGDGGFGYDPLFFVPEYGCTFGELPAAIKNRVSHRAQALAAFADALKIKIQE